MSNINLRITQSFDQDNYNLFLVKRENGKKFCLIAKDLDWVEIPEGGKFVRFSTCDEIQNLSSVVSTPAVTLKQESTEAEINYLKQIISQQQQTINKLIEIRTPIIAINDSKVTTN